MPAKKKTSKPSATRTKGARVRPRFKRSKAQSTLTAGCSSVAGIVRALEKHDFKAAGKLGNILTITVSEGPPSKE